MLLVVPKAENVVRIQSVGAALGQARHVSHLHVETRVDPRRDTLSAVDMVAAGFAVVPVASCCLDFNLVPAVTERHTQEDVYTKCADPLMIERVIQTSTQPPTIASLP